MLDSKNILLDIGRGSTHDSVGAPENTQDPAAETPNAFSAVFGHAAATLKAAKSGNDLPPSPADKKPGAQASSPDSSLVSRTLRGGTSLIVGGDEPTDEGLIAFARAQGMDPDMLGLMSAKPHKIAEQHALYQAAAANMPTGDTLGVIEGRFSRAAAGAATPEASKLIDPSALQSEPLSPGSIEPKIAAPEASRDLAIHQPMVTAHSTPASGEKKLSEMRRLMPDVASVVTGKLEKNLYIKTETLSSNVKLGSAVETVSATVSQTGVNKLVIEPKVAEAFVGLSKDRKHLPAINVESTSRAKLGSADEMVSATVSQTGVNKLVIEPKVAEAFMKLAKDRQHLPATKVEPIILTADKAGVIPAPTVATGAVAGPVFVEGQTAVAQSATLAEQVTDRQPEDPRQDLLRRQDDYMQLSRQLADALGKRLTAQIQQGSWRVEMDLHPKTLGRIEVQLEMKNGEIEARFITANAATRDLINEGMPRLREAFQEYGTETAYVDVGTANQGFSDGKSTASEDAEKGASDGLTEASEDVDGATENRQTGLESDENGLNILV